MGEHVIIFGKIMITTVLVISIIFIKTLIKLSINRQRVEREISETTVDKMTSIGSINQLTILPLIDYYTDIDGLKTEAGVSYHITADDFQILLDLGANGKKEHPSALIHNLNQLGKSLDELDAIFISHNHLDHVGGMKEQKEGTFSLSRGMVKVPVIPAYCPIHISPSKYNPGPVVHVINKPHVIKNGIVAIGAMPRALYLMGYTLENSLAFNVEGKGIVLVIGCGHQTIERILERAKSLFDEPIYGIIGGLHLPAGGGRIKIGPIDIQPIVGTDRVPWNKINSKDTESAIEVIKSVKPSLVALSPHDSSDKSLEMFSCVFGELFQIIKVGKPIVI
jgi:7,8-dihydropterin-6-yl-methyl-4-(beta-D-ribofuranosyl)aminobenzene 5'-phosphate synthase